MFFFSSFLGFVWDNNSTLLLIMIREDMDTEFQRTKSRKVKNWNEVSNYMKNLYYDVTYAKCDRKWRNLVATYKRLRDMMKKSSEGSLPEWQIHRRLDSFFSSKLAISPPLSHLAGSMMNANEPLMVLKVLFFHVHFFLISRFRMDNNSTLLLIMMRRYGCQVPET